MLSEKWRGLSPFNEEVQQSHPHIPPKLLFSPKKLFSEVVKSWIRESIAITLSYTSLFDSGHGTLSSMRQCRIESWRDPVFCVILTWLHNPLPKIQRSSSKYESPLPQSNCLTSWIIQIHPFLSFQISWFWTWEDRIIRKRDTQCH